MSAEVLSLAGRLLVADAPRPFRLWDANAKKHLPRRCYSVRINAHKAALWEAGIAKVATTIEVYDVRNGSLLSQFTRSPSGTVKVYLRRGELNHA